MGALRRLSRHLLVALVMGGFVAALAPGAEVAADAAFAGRVLLCAAAVAVALPIARRVLPGPAEPDPVLVPREVAAEETPGRD